jgi:hypothetical protein
MRTFRLSPIRIAAPKRWRRRQLAEPRTEDWSEYKVKGARAAMGAIESLFKKTVRQQMIRKASDYMTSSARGPALLERLRFVHEIHMMTVHHPQEDTSDEKDFIGPAYRRAYGTAHNR